MRVHRLAADGGAGVAGRGAQALGRRAGAQPPGGVAGRARLPRRHRLGSGQCRHPAALRPAVARHAAGQGRAVARCHLPSPLRLRRGRRHGGRRNDGHVTVLTPRTPHTGRGALPCGLISKASAQTVDTRWPWALILPIVLPGVEQPPAFLVMGISSRLPITELYWAFYELLGAVISATFATI